MKRTLKLAVVLAMAMAVPAALAQGPGASVYHAKCQGCHGPHGQAKAPMSAMFNVKPFNIKGMSNAELTTIVENGKGKMHGYKGKLSPKQIKDVLAYVHTLVKK